MSIYESNYFCGAFNVIHVTMKKEERKGEEKERIRKKIKITVSTIPLLTKDTDRDAESAEQLKSFEHIPKSNLLRET